MNESIRTLVYVGVGVVAVLAAYASRPSNLPPPPDPVGKQLFPDFKDPLTAKSLEIKQFDEATARAKSFMVSQQGDKWVIPSHGNYPADAEAQLKAVAEALADLKVIWSQPEPASEHGRYGVLDPDKAEIGAAGVGTLVTVQDAKGNDLVRLIVGKEAKREAGDAPNQRFVRKPSEDLVYVTTIDLSKLPMEFEKWIEKDLLKLSTFDVSRVTLKDYLLLPTQSGGMGLLPRMDASLLYDNGKGEWKLEEMFVYSRDGKKPSPLNDQEELNKQKLDDLRNGLGDVKIVDVVKKPGDLGGSLKVGKDKLTPDQQEALREYGFFPQAAADGTLDIYGANGEVIVETKDGVQYSLRFGDIAPQAEVTSTTTKKPEATPKGEEEKVKVHRYLFVTAQLAPSVLKEPELEPEPAGPANEPKPAEGEKKAGDAEKKDAKAGEEKKDDVKPLDPAQAERERIKKENDRKRNEAHDKRKKAEIRVAELNARFADWYYVVSEDVYKKIRLVRSDIVKEASTATTEGFGIDAFRKLEDEGLKGASPAKPAMPLLPQ
jgi:Domain of unknown function (DUF4340)